jgi:hypothetical protein
MAKFHVNSETGIPGKCRASAGNCPFGSDDQHFSSKGEAQAAYENQMQELAKFKESPLGKLDSVTDKAVQTFKKGFDNAVAWLDDHPKVVMTGMAVIATAAAAIVAHKIATDYFSSTSSTPFTGTITEGHTDSHVVGIIGKGGHIDNDAVYQVTGPDGQSFEYVTENSQLMPNGTELPLHMYSDGGIHDTSIAESATGGIIASTVGGGALGTAAGAVSGALTVLGITRLREYLDATWNMRHEKRFGLTNWR